nr:copia protein [Tanacetum cinerariifolium]
MVDDDVGEEEANKRNTKVVNNNNEEDESIKVDEIVNIKESKNHPLDQVIGILNQRTLRSQAQNHKNPKTTNLEAVKSILRYIRGTSHLGLWYTKETSTETIVYADSDYAGDCVDHKNTSGVCTLIGCCLTSCFAMKQTALAISTAEAEYVFIEKACQQALWMKQALIDYGIRLDDVLIMCDNKGAIDLSKNLVQHSRTKHIEIRPHFLRDNIQKGNISIKKFASEDNIADIFSKSLKCKVFNYLRLGLGMMKLIMDSDSPSSQK